MIPFNNRYLTYNPPQMLPTTTLNPLPTSTATDSPTSTSTQNARIKRALEALNVPTDRAQLDQWWYIALGMTILGGIGWFCI
jgi:hypothetical protein